MLFSARIPTVNMYTNVILAWFVKVVSLQIFLRFWEKEISLTSKLSAYLFAFTTMELATEDIGDVLELIYKDDTNKAEKIKKHLHHLLKICGN